MNTGNQAPQSKKQGGNTLALLNMIVSRSLIAMLFLLAFFLGFSIKAYANAFLFRQKNLVSVEKQPFPAHVSSSSQISIRNPTCGTTK